MPSLYLSRAGTSTPVKVEVMPMDGPSLASSATSAACSRVLAGTQPQCRQVPPTFSFSIRTTAELGSSVVLIEKEKVGGTCLHWGCVPAKTLLHAAEVADEAREGPSIGITSTFTGVDVPALLKYKDGIVNRLYKGLQGLIKSRKIQLVEGEGKFVRPNTVVVGGDRFIGKDVVLATGSYSRSLPGLEIEGRVITSTQGLSLEWIPETAIVLGGGVIGVEFASTWASFGTKVTIVEALPTLVPLEDPWASKLLERAFRKRKIAFSTGVRFASVTQDDSGVTVTLE